MKSDNSIYRKLQKHIDNMPLGYPETESGVEIRLLKHLFNPEEAEIALALSALPERLERIHKRLKKTGISIDKLEKILDNLVKKGAIMGGEYFRVLGDGKFYSKALLAIGMYELQVDKLTKEYQNDFEEYGDDKFGLEFHSGTSQIRTIPINKSITPEKNISSYDDSRKIILDSNGTIGVAECVCKQGKDLIKDPCRNSEIRETCIVFYKHADHLIDLGSARKISKDEALEIIDRAEKAGLILQPENSQTPHFICCCCGCCCGALVSVKKLPKPAQYYHSSYYAKVNPELCNGCKKCIKRCQLDAVSIENKIACIDLDRCIGCGACITTCPTNSLELMEKEKKFIPPKNHALLYIKMFGEKVGFFGMLKLFFKAVFHMKI